MQDRLDLGRGDLKPADFDHLLQAIGDRQVAQRVELSNVSRAIPTIGECSGHVSGQRARHHRSQPAWISPCSPVDKYRTGLWRHDAQFDALNR